MKKLIKNEKTLQIIQGCIYFIELKNGISNLTDKNSMPSLSSLYNYLSSKSEGSRFARCIQLTLKRFLLSSEGYVYLSDIINTTNFEESKKIADTLTKTSSLMTKDIDSIWSMLAKMTGNDEQVINRLLTRLLVR